MHPFKIVNILPIAIIKSLKINIFDFRVKSRITMAFAKGGSYERRNSIYQKCFSAGFTFGCRWHTCGSHWLCWPGGCQSSSARWSELSVVEPAAYAIAPVALHNLLLFLFCFRSRKTHILHSVFLVKTSHRLRPKFSGLVQKYGRIISLRSIRSIFSILTAISSKFTSVTGVLAFNPLERSLGMKAWSFLNFLGNRKSVFHLSFPRNVWPLLG